MISDEVMTRLRALVTTLQASTGPKKLSGHEDYDYGFADRQIQAGNDLEALLDDLSGVERRPDA